MPPVTFTLPDRLTVRAMLSRSKRLPVATTRFPDEPCWLPSILVCGTILGLFALRPIPEVAVPSALILFREFAVSALRESAAARGQTLKVTWLAKWKTTLQLLAFGLLLMVESWVSLGLEPNPDVIGPIRTTGVALIWIAALVTVWTGWDYARAARKAIPHEQ